MMMEKQSSCKHFIGLISEYIDGDLAESLCAELERHLKGCRNCQVILDTTLKTISLYQACTGDDCLPDDVQHRLFARLNLEEFEVQKLGGSQKDSIVNG